MHRSVPATNKTQNQFARIRSLLIDQCIHRFDVRAGNTSFANTADNIRMCIVHKQTNISPRLLERIFIFVSHSSNVNDLSREILLLPAHITQINYKYSDIHIIHRRRKSYHITRKTFKSIQRICVNYEATLQKRRISPTHPNSKSRFFSSFVCVPYNPILFENVEINNNRIFDVRTSRTNQRT